MVLINRWWCRVACILKDRKVQSSWNKFRTPVFRFGLFETTDALTFSFDKFTTNAINLFKLPSITSDCLTESDSKWCSTAAMFVSWQGWARWWHARWGHNQDGSLIARFSCNNFIWYGSIIEAETLWSILSLY